MSLPLLGASADWNQWRGPDRNGVLTGGPTLANVWPKEGPAQLWDSELIPSDDDGGHGSMVTAGGKVFLALVWHSDVPTETRAIDELVLRKLDHRGLNWPEELIDKMETARLTIPPALRGAKLDEWAQQWVADNLNPEQRQTQGSWVVGRFKKGRAAVSIADFKKLEKVRSERFPNEGELVKWVDSQDFSEDVRRLVLDAVPPTRKAAEDVVVCLDLATGNTLWKSKMPGEPTGRGSSSTPCVVAGRVYALCSRTAYCLEADTGKVLWATPLSARGPASSPLVVDGLLVFMAGPLTALEAKTGQPAWVQKQVAGNNSSPALWTREGRSLLLCNARNEIAAVEPATGKVLWTVPSGGDSTPAVHGDHLAVFSRNKELGLSAYLLDTGGAKKLWSFPIDHLRSQSSPIIFGGHVFLSDADLQLCVHLATGQPAWQEMIPNTISSPLIADGKLFALQNNGNNITMMKASPEARVELAKANVRALWVSSPAIADGKLLLRLKDRVRCFDLVEPVRGVAGAR